LTNKQKRIFEEQNELDFSFGVKGIGRVRANIFKQRGTVGAALRNIPYNIPTFEELGLPPIVREIVKLNQGLVLVTGPTGSGKSTTLASMIDYINTQRSEHIITIEDPIEFLHSHKNSIVCQREIGSDTETYANALKYILRQDPDIILIGELRDLETISAALTISETGHLVFATLHTPDAAQTINRIIDVFPPHQQQQVRVQLSFVLQGIFSQKLLPHAYGRGRVLACEVLIANAGIRNMIRENKIHLIYSAIQSGKEAGMQTMNASLYNLYVRGHITQSVALNASPDPKELKEIMGSKAARREMHYV
jgi:twitching motility protein PilT